MSPSSSGALEVERYIGACLITSQNQGRHRKSTPNIDHRYQQHRDQWIGGVPLINYSHQSRWRQTERGYHNNNNNNPLTRLAVHTQGAPLILSDRYNGAKKRYHQSKNYSCNNSNKIFDNTALNLTNLSADTVSVASDESSGSNNSETCLPRIIKPRKRRKKDRKPPHLLRPPSQEDSFSTDSGSPDLDSSSSLISFSFSPYFTYLTRQTNSGDFLSEPPPPNLHHSFDDLEDFDLNGSQSESSCQCKYCDPNGQIWDVDRSCYSPFPTPDSPTKSYSSSMLDCFTSMTLEDEPKTSSEPTAVRRTGSDLEVSTEIVTSANGHRDLEIKFFSQYSNRTKAIGQCSGVNRSGGRDAPSTLFGG